MFDKTGFWKKCVDLAEPYWKVMTFPQANSDCNFFTFSRYLNIKQKGYAHSNYSCVV
jgi:hypothetical protein